MLNYIYKKFLETPLAKRDRKARELEKQNWILHEISYRKVMANLQEYFKLQEQILDLVEKKNKLVKFHFCKLTHLSHKDIWVEPDLNEEDYNDDEEQGVNVVRQSMSFYIDDSDSSIDSLE